VSDLPEAIPGCAPWREANPEPIAPGWVETLAPAPYCCSAYCMRCAAARARDGEPPLAPNQWLHDNPHTIPAEWKESTGA
jgi:hypothetical protein